MSAPEWNPIDPDEQGVKSVFEKLSAVTEKVVFPSAGPAQANRFILRSKGILDLQAYVLSGKEFPNTHQRFDEKIGQDAFRKLSNFDSEIYDRTRDAVVATGSTCTEYHENHLSKLVNAGQLAIHFSDNTVELLENADGMNLRYNLNVILDPKYTSRDKFDEAYRDAKEAAQMVLRMLSDDAKDKKRATDEILQTLITFKSNTMKNQENVEFLTRQFKTGPVQNQSPDYKTPYVEFLNPELSNSIARFNQLVQQARDTSSDWEKNTATAIGTCFLVTAGWIVMDIHAAKAKGIRDEHDKLQDQIGRYSQERKEETDLIRLVNQMSTQCTNIDAKMTAAIAAMSELSQLFSQQADCYDGIGFSLNRFKTSPDISAQNTRRAWVDSQTKACVQKLKELKVVAQEFTRSMMTQVTLSS